MDVTLYFPKTGSVPFRAAITTALVEASEKNGF
jgi:hypothetical protein